ncbi:hypothetical protein [Mucilaginibacter sp. SP1R1]|uniref:hypothetical protein n=1 Tax=Mucilaginibacter sp. SP1R1 TaxID=2723091 RepID=UPI00160DAC57|nr:hypothetical protein [Mucilaginibacter sp. SP1R1]MBB6149484.1 hypothetical protein [Mucilaginibacter sp. SP1R1]
MGLHHATLGSAVKKYGPLHTEGKTEDEIKLAIAADEKGFDPAGIDEIYAAIIADPNEPGESPAPAKAKKVKGHVVLTQFRDKDNFAKLYEVGDDVSHFDEARKAGLVDRKLIEAI